VQLTTACPKRATVATV